MHNLIEYLYDLLIGIVAIFVFRLLMSILNVDLSNPNISELILNISFAMIGILLYEYVKNNN